MTSEEKLWIRNHRLKNAYWKNYFEHEHMEMGKRDFGNIKNMTIMIRDILDAKANRTHELRFSKNPHVAQLAKLAGLRSNGTKNKQQIIIEQIIKNI